MAPESCGHGRKDVLEALTGVHAGRVLSRERFNLPGAQAFLTVEGNTNHSAKARGGGPGAVEDPEHAWTHLVREPGDPVTASGRMVNRGRGGKSKDAIRR